MSANQSVSCRRIRYWINQVVLGESFKSQLTGVAMPARGAVERRIVAAGGQRVVHVQRLAKFYYLRFAQVLLRRMKFESRQSVRFTLNAGTRGQVGHVFKRRDVLRTTIRIAGIVQLSPIA